MACRLESRAPLWLDYLRYPVWGFLGYILFSEIAMCFNLVGSFRFSFLGLFSMLFASIYSWSPAMAAVDPKVHNICASASDYEGCVKANSATPHVLGNSCQSRYACEGDGFCRKVICTWANHHSQMLSGTKWKCVNKGILAMHLSTGSRAPLVNAPACPPGIPEVGWTSTYEFPYSEPQRSMRVGGNYVNY